MCWLSNGGNERNEIWQKGSLGDEHDAQNSNTRIVHRKHDTTLDGEKYSLQRNRVL